jgi:hypothetical protein
MLTIQIYIVTDLIKAFPGNSSVNTNTGNNRRETVFYAVRAEQKPGAIGSLLPGDTAVDMHPQQWKTVFSVGPCKGVILKTNGAMSSVPSSR